MRKILLFAAAVAFAAGSFLASCAAQAKPVSQSADVGSYRLTLKILPAEAFAGPHTEMVWDGGAKPYLLTASPRPNHHLVVFVKHNGKPVEDAVIHIRYRMLGKTSSPWQTLPVVRMYVKGKGKTTMHYGNNVQLAPGRYAVAVQLAKMPVHIFRVHIGR